MLKLLLNASHSFVTQDYSWEHWASDISVTAEGISSSMYQPRSGAMSELADPGLSPTGPLLRAAATSRGAGPSAQSAGDGRVHIPTAPLLPYWDTAPRGIQLLLKISPGRSQIC